jgi:predicted GIY-YIG superfamily endonuclease
MPIKYQLGKIYKILDNTNGNIYIGSTCEPTLARRLTNHVSNYKRYLKKLHRYTSSFEIIKNGNYNIMLIELYPCNSKNELISKERHHIETLNCVNKVVPGRTDREYYLDHQENEIKRGLEYRNENRITITCICGSSHYKYCKPHHIRTVKHKEYMINIKTFLHEGQKAIKLADALINEVENIKPLKMTI